MSLYVVRRAKKEAFNNLEIYASSPFIAKEVSVLLHDDFPKLRRHFVNHKICSRSPVHHAVHIATSQRATCSKGPFLPEVSNTGQPLA